MRPAMTANDFRLNAAEDGDPLLLGAQDKIHYAELLIRFHDHRVLSEHYQFWGNLADLLNMAMHIPDRTVHGPRDWTVFNTFQAMANGYITMSEASDEDKRELLRRYFPPEPEQDHDQEPEQEPERHPDAYEYGEPWGPDNPAPGSAWDNGQPRSGDDER